MDETKPQPEVVSAITVEPPKPEAKKDGVENLVIETYEPKKSCRKCHGRGIIGLIEGDPNKPYYCTCIMKVKKELTPAQVKAVTKAGVVLPKTEPTVVQDSSNEGVGPCPTGVHGIPGVAGDPKASV